MEALLDGLRVDWPAFGRGGRTARAQRKRSRPRLLTQLVERFGVEEEVAEEVAGGSAATTAEENAQLRGDVAALLQPILEVHAVRLQARVRAARARREYEARRAAAKADASAAAAGCTAAAAAAAPAAADGESFVRVH